MPLLKAVANCVVSWIVVKMDAELFALEFADVTSDASTFDVSVRNSMLSSNGLSRNILVGLSLLET